MRMVKRIAVSLLAAAMALSMLTACGGGGNANSGGTSGGSGGGSNNSNNSSNTGSSDNGSSGNNGASNKDDKNDLTISNDLTKLPDGTEIRYADSQTKKWYNIYNFSKKLYMVTEESSPNIMKCVDEVAKDGKTIYNKCTWENGVVDESLTLPDLDYYILYSNVKIATTLVLSDSSSRTTSRERFTSTMKKTTHVEENVPYYAEIETLTEQTTGEVYEVIHCYDSTGALVYIIQNPGTENEKKSHVLKCSTSIPSTAILKIPSDWKIYTFICGKDGVLEKIIAPDGHELTDEERDELYKKIYP